MATPFAVPWRGDVNGARIIHLAPSAPPLVPVLDPDAEVTPDVDRVLTLVAIEARAGDVAARNALFAACEPKIARFARRYRTFSTRPDGRFTLDPDDLAQEAFLVFVDLVAGWPGGESFGAYFLGHFPWALRNAVRRLTAADRRSVCFSLAPGVFLLADGSAAAEEAVALLEALAETLPHLDGAILLWRIRDGERLGTIARRLGTSRRTVMRAWDRIVADLRRSYGR